MLAVLVPALVALSVIDVRTRRLPTRIIGPVAVASVGWFGVVAVVERDVEPPARAFGCALTVLALAVVLHLASPDGLGLGDVRLAGLLALDLGWLGLGEAALGLTVGVGLAALAGGVLVAVGARTRHDGLPLGPFLAAGAVVAIAAAV
jgi:leader peptidase (prepilin peptidase)/N-methyltransferase